MKTLLEVKNIKVYYNQVILALRGVSLKVDEGSIVTLLGANGSGKSTTLKAISGLLSLENGRVTEGDIIFEEGSTLGKPTVSLAKSGICQVMEGREICKNLTVEENLKLGTLIRNVKRNERKDAYEVIYRYFPVLKERRNQTAGYLSGGEQQMLAIGRALMTKPKLLLLDEPSLGLAPLVAENVFEILKQINQEQGTTILVVEQNASLALSAASYAFILANGKVVMEGPTSGIDTQDIRNVYLGAGSKENQAS
ncbi:MAG: ABC transporter ATP-binding protein [Desulfitobacteriaceae bacterium]